MLGEKIKMRSLIPRLLIVLVAALVGASIGKVTSFDLVYSAIAGGLIAAIAVGIATLFSPKTSEFENTTPPRKLLGLRIGVVGGVVAICGWVVTVFVSQVTGFFIAVTGIAIGFVGIAVGFINMFLK